MKAVILAGGFGTRMRPLTLSRPKPLLPILNRPVTAHILDHLKENGVTEVAITTNYLREQIQEYFGKSYRGIELIYPIEEQPLGTAGCVKNIADWLDDTFIIMQGDIITDIDLKALLSAHNYFSGLATIAAVRVEDPWNFGVMEVADNGRIRKFQEKPLKNQCTTNLANTGIYVLEPESMDYVPKGSFFDFAKDLFPILLERQSIYATPTDAFWVDVGRPEGYTSAKKWMMSKMASEIPDSSSIDGRVEGIMSLGQNVKIGSTSHIIGPVFIGDNVEVGKGCVIGPYTVLGTGVTIREYSVLNGAVLFEGIELGSGEDISNSFIAENCRIGSGARIQSDVMIGGSCRLEENVSVINGSRIWPNMDISGNSMVSGTLRRFIQVHEVREDPKWTLRTVTPDEAFYFNKLEGNHVSFTGQRALSLLEFGQIMKQIELSSVDYHIRSDINDFQLWLEKVICDDTLSENFNEIKKECVSLDRKLIRHRMIEATNERLNQLLEVVKPKGYA